MQESSKTSRLVRAAQALFFLNAAIWVGFGIWSLLRIGGGPAPAITQWIIAVLMFGNAVAMLLSGAGIGTRQRWLFLLAFLVLVVNIVLTVTDEFGLLDLLTLLIDLVLLGILILVRRRFSRSAVTG